MTWLESTEQCAVQLGIINTDIHNLILAPVCGEFASNYHLMDEDIGKIITYFTPHSAPQFQYFSMVQMISCLKIDNKSIIKGK